MRLQCSTLTHPLCPVSAVLLLWPPGLIARVQQVSQQELLTLPVGVTLAWALAALEQLWWEAEAEGEGDEEGEAEEGQGGGELEEDEEERARSEGSGVGPDDDNGSGSGAEGGQRRAGRPGSRLAPPRPEGEEEAEELREEQGARSDDVGGSGAEGERTLQQRGSRLVRAMPRLLVYTAAKVLGCKPGALSGAPPALQVGLTHETTLLAMHAHTRAH
jgi:hypothetical protein